VPHGPCPICSTFGHSCALSDDNARALTCCDCPIYLGAHGSATRPADDTDEMSTARTLVNKHVVGGCSPVHTDMAGCVMSTWVLTT
jgi:hypothetical protein